MRFFRQVLLGGHFTRSANVISRRAPAGPLVVLDLAIVSCAVGVVYRHIPYAEPDWSRLGQLAQLGVNERDKSLRMLFTTLEERKLVQQRSEVVDSTVGSGAADGQVRTPCTLRAAQTQVQGVALLTHAVQFPVPRATVA